MILRSHGHEDHILNDVYCEVLICPLWLLRCTAWFSCAAAPQREADRTVSLPVTVENSHRPERRQTRLSPQSQQESDELRSEGFRSQREAFLKEIREVLGDSRDVLWTELREIVQRLQYTVDNIQQGRVQDKQDVMTFFNKSIDDLIAADDGVRSKIDFMVTMLMAVRGEGTDTPRLACVLPPWTFALSSGLSEDEQKPEAWIERLDKWREGDFKDGTGLFEKKSRLFLVCAYSHRLVPCGHNGQGYKIKYLRKWVGKAFRVITFALQVALATVGAIAVAPLTTAAGAATTAALNRVVSELESLRLEDGVAEGQQLREVWRSSRRLRLRLRCLLCEMVSIGAVWRPSSLALFTPKRTIFTCFEVRMYLI